MLYDINEKARSEELMRIKALQDYTDRDRKEMVDRELYLEEEGIRRVKIVINVQRKELNRKQESLLRNQINLQRAHRDSLQKETLDYGKRIIEDAEEMKRQELEEDRQRYLKNKKLQEFLKLQMEEKRNRNDDALTQSEIMMNKSILDEIERNPTLNNQIEMVLTNTMQSFRNPL